MPTTHENSRTLETDLDAVKRDLASLRTDLKGLTDSLLNQGKQSARAAGDQIHKSVSDSTETVRTNIAEHPLASIAIASAVGLVLGMALHRR